MRLFFDDNGSATVETALVFMLAAVCIIGGTVCVLRSTGTLLRTVDASAVAGNGISLDPCAFCGNLDTGLRCTDVLLDGVDWVTGKIGGR